MGIKWYGVYCKSIEDKETQLQVEKCSDVNRGDSKRTVFIKKGLVI